MGGRRYRFTRSSFANILNPCDQVAHFARAEFRHGHHDGCAGANLFDVVHRIGLHEAQF